MEKSEIALQLTLKAMEQGLIVGKTFQAFDSEDPIEAANQYTAKQVNDFYRETYKRLLNNT